MALEHAIDDAWSVAASHVKLLLDIPSISIDLVRDALTSAHRDRDGMYHSDGNRIIPAGTGKIALEFCIWTGSKDKNSSFKCWCKQLRSLLLTGLMLEPPASALNKWPRLRSNQVLCEIAYHSRLNHHIATSIRQHGELVQEPLSSKVAAYAVRALIGAVFEESGRNIDTTSKAIDALCRYLPSPEDDVFTQHSASSLETHPSPGVTSEETVHPSRESPLPCSTPISRRTPSGFFQPLSMVEYDPVLDNMEAVLQRDLDSSDLQGMDSLDYINSSQRDEEGQSAKDGAHELLHQFGNMTLAHASSDGQRAYVLKPLQPFAPSPKCASKSSQEPPSSPEPLQASSEPPRKRKKPGPKLGRHEQYMQSQQQDVRQGSLNANDPGPSTEPSTVSSEHSKYSKTLQKLLYGTMSSFAVLRIKEALESRTSALSMSESVVAPQHPSDTDETTTPAYHYRKVTSMLGSRSYNSIVTQYHLCLLYQAIRDQIKVLSDRDDGFQRNDITSMEENKGKKQRYQTIISKSYEDMLHKFEPDFEHKSEDEQKRLRDEVGDLRKTGTRLDLFVRCFGIGILCLLPFARNSTNKEQELAVTESQFRRLNEKDMKSLVNKLSPRRRDYLKRLSQAAKPVLETLIDIPACGNRRFRCEDTDVSRINQLSIESEEIIQELEVA